MPGFAAETLNKSAYSSTALIIAHKKIRNCSFSSNTVNNANMYGWDSDDYVRDNAQVRERIGLQTTITRIVAAGCCEWCSGMGGSWIYGTEPANIYRRHEYCRCTVTYESDRTRQNVWSKRQWEATPEEIVERRASGRPAGMTMQERINVVDQIERDQVVRWYMNATGASRDLALRKTQGRSLKEIRSMITTALRR